MKTGYTVMDAMTTKPITVPPSTTVRDASIVMSKHDVGSLLVVEDSVLLGIITAEDFVTRVTAEAKDVSIPVSEVMTKDIIDIVPEADVYDAMVLMKEHDILHLPVRDDKKRLVGFLTLKDVLRIEPQLFEIITEMAELKQKPGKRKEGYCEECGNYAEQLVNVKGRWLCQYCGEQ